MSGFKEYFLKELKESSFVQISYESFLISHIGMSVFLVLITPYTPISDVLVVWGITCAVLFNYEYLWFNRHAPQSRDIGHSN